MEGSPGEAPRLTGLLKSFWPFFLIFAAAGYLLRAAWPHPEIKVIHAGFLLLMLAGAFAAALLAMERRMKAYLKGARGEESVGRALGFLPVGYSVFHGVPLSGSGMIKTAAELDHVVVGPTGVFAVETKNWSGRITVEAGAVLYNGIEPDRPPLDQVRQSAGLLEKALSGHLKIDLPVQPILCFASSRIARGSIGVDGVVVCESGSLNRVVMDSVETPLGEDIRKQAAAWLTGQVNRDRA
ncbi:MAG: nuclease-related domain-containing protein [Verrucomicrobiota bacterium]